MKKKITAGILILALALSLGACGAKDTQEQTQTADQQVQQHQSTVNQSAAVSTGSAIDTSDIFTKRDLEQSPDLTDAVTYTLRDGEDISISEAGIYVLSGSAKEVTVTVDAGDDDKVQIVLSGADITNTDFPCIYVKNADKVFVTTAEGTKNSLTVSGTFTADGETNTDAVIFSRDDLVLNGKGSLSVSSTDNGISCKDDLKITGGTLTVSAADCALEANDSIAVADGTITLTAGNDGLHAENDDDNTLGYIYISGGKLTINAGDDGIHATTVFMIDGGEVSVTAAEGIEGTQIYINDGTVNVKATDDGVNAANKSDAYSILFEMNGGYLTISMGAGDTDAIDSNGSITVNGGTIDITAQSPFDYDRTAAFNGGTIIVNGTTVSSISNQFMGGQGGGMGPMQGDPGNSQGPMQGMPGQNMGPGQGNPGGMPRPGRH